MTIRRLSAFLVLLLAASTAAALQPPLKINFQGKLLDASNNPRNGTVDLIFRLYDAASGGNPLQAGGSAWTETQAGVSVVNGVFSVQVGAVRGLSPDLFAGTSAYLDVQVDATNAGGPTGYQTLTPRQQFVTSPYAFSAAQLVGENSLRINAGPNHSTFTVSGDLLVPYGLVAGTGSFSGALTASSGTFKASGLGQFSLVTASGIYVSSGILNVNAGGGIVSRYGLAAATGTFSGTGGYSLVTASGVNVQAGTVTVRGGGGLVADYGLTAATGTFFAANASQYTLQTASGIAMLDGSLQLGDDDRRTLTVDPAAGDIEVSTDVVVVGSMSATNFNEVFLASATLTAPGATLNISFNGQNYQTLHVILQISGVAAANTVWMRFNGDATANYAWTASNNSAAATATPSVAQIAFQTATNANPGFFDIRIKNVPGTGKIAWWDGARATVITTAPTFYNGAGFWGNTASWITTINILNSAGNNFSAGTAIRVFGIQ